MEVCDTFEKICILSSVHGAKAKSLAKDHEIRTKTEREILLMNMQAMTTREYMSLRRQTSRVTRPMINKLLE